MKIRNQAASTNANKGMSLTELLIVMAIMGIVLSIANFSWQAYVVRSNLRTAARQVASDISKYQARAIAEGRNYTITFNATDKYNISAPVRDDLVAFNLDATPIEAGRTQDAQITNSNFTACNVVIMTSRGLLQHCNMATVSNNTGTVTLTNSRGGTATITVNIRGKVDVTFANLY